MANDEPADGETSRAVPGSLSVREICKFGLLAEARLLAGAAGLDRRVHRLNVMSVPDITRWTKAHELLLVTGYPLPDAPQEQIRLLTELNTRGVAAVGVKYGSYGPGVMPEVLHAADRLELPIIDIPDTVAFDDVLTQVLSAIANRQAATLARAQEIHESLLEIFLSGGALSDIVQGLSTALGDAGVICVDPAGQVLAQRANEAHWERLYLQHVLDAEGRITVDRLPGVLSQHVTGQKLAAAPVLAGTLRHGHLLAVCEADALPPEAEVMVQQSAMVAALEITQRLAVSTVERHFEANAIHELLTSGETGLHDVLLRAGSFGWDLDRSLIVLVARRDPHATAAAHGELRYEHDMDAWISTVRNVDRTAAVGGFGRNLVAVCGVGDGAESTARTISQSLHGMTRRNFSIGASGVVSAPEHLQAAYQHASVALDITQRISGPNSVMSYETLGLLRLLNAVSDPAELRTFVDEVMGGVLDRPPEERADLLQTLDVLLAHHLNVAESARALHFHYNTMRYRIAKLQRLLGPFTEDNKLCLRLSVAMEIIHMWEMSGDHPSIATRPRI